MIPEFIHGKTRASSYHLLLLIPLRALFRYSVFIFSYPTHCSRVWFHNPWTLTRHLKNVVLRISPIIFKCRQRNCYNIYPCRTGKVFTWLFTADPDLLCLVKWVLSICFVCPRKTNKSGDHVLILITSGCNRARLVYRHTCEGGIQPTLFTSHQASN